MSLSRQQITLLGIFALFLGPVILVILMRSSWWQYQPAGLKNEGQLIQPPVHLALNQSPDIDGKWLILYVLGPACDQQCTDQVTALRQIHIVAGRNRKHIALVLLSKAKAATTLQSRLESIYPEFQFLTDTSATAFTTLDAINAGLTGNTEGSNTPHTYILDPMLNVILAYGVSANPNDIHKDLRRLLKWSDQENKQ